MGKKYLALIMLTFSILTQGCMAHYQTLLKDLDAYWYEENNKLLATIGTKYYDMPLDKAHRAMLLALSNVELLIEQQDSNAGFIVAKANAPRPLTEHEWRQVQEIETPIADKITGSSVILSTANREVIINSIILKRDKGVEINLRFRIKYTGDTHGLVFGTQPPPEALKLGIRKIWDEFEKTAFVQAKTLD